MVRVTDSVSAGLTLQSMSGTGWTCAGTTCTRTDSLSPGSSYPPITVKVNVAAGASSPQQNTGTVSGGGDTASHSSVDSTTILAGITYTLSGTVTFSGAALSGATITLSGSMGASTTTNSSGGFTFTGVPAGGSYTLTPSAANYLFTPASQSITNLSASQTINFDATANLAYGKTATQSST